MSKIYSLLGLLVTLQTRLDFDAQVRHDVLVYSNQLVYAERDPVHSFIIRHYNWTVGVECDVQRNESSSGMSALSVEVTWDAKYQYQSTVKIQSGNTVLV
ncbi:hypothetical protein DPMN_115559 [Dreissena polymorpha]|uniref:Uncharacterized protein n=1 Tax=Dreissena polymorpha TaxID=45954 RepID=A0A9D4QSK7_DREPO|nr:hypothetical protein DPMN_115559 [Dreissena polymorpha]